MKISCSLLCLLVSATLASAGPLSHSVDFKMSGKSAIKN